MNTPVPSPIQPEDGTYDIRLRGHLDLSWADRLGVPRLIHEQGGITLLAGIPADQASLHGLLQRVRDLGVPLISASHRPRVSTTNNSRNQETAMTTTTKTPAKTGPITPANLIRVSGLFAAAAGLIFAAIQPVHPADVLASVTTLNWTIIISLKFAMCLFFLIGIAGLYFRQMSKAGWLGLTGFVLFSLSWWLQTGYVFTDLFTLPPVATMAPQFVDSFLGIVNGHPGATDIGAIVPAYSAIGLLYLVGGITFGIATFRAGVLPRVPSILLAATALLTPAAVLLPHAIQRFAAVPMGIAFIWLGLAVWQAHRSAKAQDVSDAVAAQV